MAEGFEIEQVLDVVFVGEAGDLMVFVLVDSVLYVVCHADVEGAGVACHYVGVEGFHGFVF